MKKIITLLFIFTIINFCFTNTYATNLTNSTLIVNPYSEIISNTDEPMDKMFDTLTIGIIVASIVIIAGVAFFYLIPKE